MQIRTLVDDTRHSLDIDPSGAALCKLREDSVSFTTQPITVRYLLVDVSGHEPTVTGAYEGLAYDPRDPQEILA